MKAKNITYVTYGRYITVDGKERYCKEFDTVEFHNQPRPVNLREICTAIAQETNTHISNIFIEAINGEALEHPTGYAE